MVVERTVIELCGNKSRFYIKCRKVTQIIDFLEALQTSFLLRVWYGHGLNIETLPDRYMHFDLIGGGEG